MQEEDQNESEHTKQTLLHPSLVPTNSTINSEFPISKNILVNQNTWPLGNCDITIYKYNRLYKHNSKHIQRTTIMLSKKDNNYEN